jgi:hypothetical protein
VVTTEDIRRWAMALPEVEETSHFRFHVPLWKVRGQDARRSFLGLQVRLAAGHHPERPAPH